MHSDGDGCILTVSHHPHSIFSRLLSTNPTSPSLHPTYTLSLRIPPRPNLLGQTLDELQLLPHALLGHADAAFSMIAREATLRRHGEIISQGVVSCAPSALALRDRVCGTQHALFQHVQRLHLGVLGRHHAQHDGLVDGQMAQRREIAGPRAVELEVKQAVRGLVEQLARDALVAAARQAHAVGEVAAADVEPHGEVGGQVRHGVVVRRDIQLEQPLQVDAVGAAGGDEGLVAEERQVRVVDLHDAQARVVQREDLLPDGGAEVLQQRLVALEQRRIERLLQLDVPPPGRRDRDLRAGPFLLGQQGAQEQPVVQVRRILQRDLLRRRVARVAALDAPLEERPVRWEVRLEVAQRRVPHREA